jgi:hypothetical protein
LASRVVGVIAPVSCYREKLLTFTRDWEKGTKANVIVPAGSVQAGVLVEQKGEVLQEQGVDPTQRASVDSQVRSGDL